MLFRSFQDRSSEVRAVVPVAVAAYLLNEKRAALNEIEVETKTRVLVIPNPNLETPHFEVLRLRDDEVDSTQEVSYKIDIAVPDADSITDSSPKANIPQQQAAVQAISPPAANTAKQKPPQSKAKSKEEQPGLLRRLREEGGRGGTEGGGR